MSNKLLKMQTIEENNLPKGWVLTKIRDIVNPSNERVNPKQSSNQIFIGLEHIEKNTGKILGSARSSETKSTKTKFSKGDILYGKLRPYLNKVCVPDFDGVCSTDILVFKKNNFINNKYISFFLSTNQFVRYSTQNMTGVQHPRINFEIIGQYDIPLPPISEQHRIVSKLEELFTKLDAAIDALKKTKIQLKNYRHSVLKYAFEGKLTEKWRETHQREIESVSAIFEKVRGLKTKDNGRKYKDISLQKKNLPQLPIEWTWILLDTVIEKMQYGTSEKATDDPNGIPVLRMGNIQDGTIIFKNLKYYPSDWKIINEFSLRPGDILFNRTNSSELVGKTAVYEDHHPKAVFASYLIRLIINREIYNPKLLSFFINSFYGRQYIYSVVSQQVGQANVNGTKLSHMPIPLFSLQEQCEMVAIIERQLSVVDQNKNTVDDTLKRASMLRNIILRKTFQGKLVPQDPNDEPACMLLKRIEEEKLKQGIKVKAKEKIKDKIDGMQTRLA